jgi:putative DNA-invertase from lambdoid prophage Rac
MSMMQDPCRMDVPCADGESMKKRAAIFTRVALEEQKKDTALKELRQYCQRMDWDIIEYKEKPSLGKDRPLLNMLMHNARQRKFEVVVVWKLDRFAHSIRHLIETVRELDANGIQFICMSEGLNTDRRSAKGRMMMQILESLAELERSTMGERVRAGVAEAKREGKHCGRPQRRIEVERAVALQKKGWSLRQIAAELEVPLTTLSVALRRLPKAPSKRTRRSSSTRSS